MSIEITPPFSTFLDDYLYGIFGLEEGQEITVTAVGSNGTHTMDHVSDAEGTVHSSFPTPDDGEVVLTVTKRNSDEVLGQITFPIQK